MEVATAPPTEGNSEAKEPQAPSPPPDPPRPSGLQAILARARSGDQAVLPELKQVLDEDPSIWQECYQLVSMAEQAWLNKIAGKDLLVSQSIRRHVEQLKKDLAGPSPSPLEKVLAERIIASWLGTQYAEVAEAAGDNTGGKVAQMRLKRLESANRRLLAATKALAVCRRLTAGLKIEIQHTHAASADDTRVDARRNTVTPVCARRMDMAGGDPVDMEPVADRLRSILRENVGAEAAASLAAER